VDSGVGYDPVPGLQCGNQPLLLLLPPHLGAEQNEVHYNKDEDERDESPDAAAGCGWSR
jgi:hypothetical protein